jgi:hypothetical protein
VTQFPLDFADEIYNILSIHPTQINESGIIAGISSYEEYGDSLNGDCSFITTL